MTPVTPSSVCDMEREAFEAHVTAVDRQMTINRHPGKSGRYVSDITAVCWGIWQARAALAERTQQEAPSEEQVLRALDTYYQHTRGACGYSDVLISRMRNVLATRPTSAADCTAPMQPSEREAFEVWRRRTTKMVNKDDSVAREGFGGDANYTDRTTRSMWIGWQAHAALAAPTQAAPAAAVEPTPERLASLLLQKMPHTFINEKTWPAMVAILREALAAPTQAPMQPSDEDRHYTIDRAADLLEMYADWIKRNVMSAQIEEHPYLPELEGVAEELRALSKEVAAPTQAPVQPSAFMDAWEQFESGNPAPTQAAPAAAVQPKRCPYCDDTGDVHGIDGEWRGRCTCPAGSATAVPEGLTKDGDAK